MSASPLLKPKAAASAKPAALPPAAKGEPNADALRAALSVEEAEHDAATTALADLTARRQDVFVNGTPDQAVEHWLREHYDPLARELIRGLSLCRDADAATKKVNSYQLPNIKSIDPVETPIRDFPGSPEKRETITVEKAIVPQGVKLSVGVNYPTREEQVERVTPATLPRRRTPLYEQIELPPLRPGDKPHRVDGTYAPGWQSII